MTANQKLLKKSVEEVKTAPFYYQTLDAGKLPGKRRVANLRAKLLSILDGATSHPEIERKLPQAETFFRKMKSPDFIALLDDAHTQTLPEGQFSDPVYTALWYHCNETMRTATEKCALFSPERMKQLYPMWREFADESRGYMGARK